MNIRKVVTGGGDDGSEQDEDVVQARRDCNEHVANLFESKEGLTSVTLTFANGGTKAYSLADSADED